MSIRILRPRDHVRQHWYKPHISRYYRGRSFGWVWGYWNRYLDFHTCEPPFVYSHDLSTIKSKL